MRLFSEMACTVFTVLALSTPLQPVLAQARLTLDEALSTFIGQPVILRGHIGSGYDWNDRTLLHFRAEDGSLFPVEFRAGRLAQRKLADCRLDLYEGGTPCALSGEGRLERKGAQLRLVITRAINIGPPQSLTTESPAP